MDSKNLSKKLLVLLLILISIAIIIAAFVGIYVRKLNKLVNIMPETTFSSEVNGNIEYRLSVDETESDEQVYVDENGNIRGKVSDGSKTSDEDWENDTGFIIQTQTIKTNDSESLNKENYEKVKTILEQRLDDLGATEYQIRLNEETGDITIELSENDDVKYLYETAVLSKGEIDIIDYQTGEVLIDKTHFKQAEEYTYSADGSTYTACLKVELDEEGAALLNEMSKKYISYTDDAGEDNIDYISVRIDGQAVYTTYFGEEYTESVINIPVGQNITDKDTLNDYVESIEAVATILNLGELPVTYNSSENSGLLIRSSITSEVLFGLKIGLIVALVLITIIFIIKYKLNGFLAGILNSAFIACLIIVLNALNIVVSISGMFAITGLVLLNTLFLDKYLKLLDKSNAYLESLKSFYGVIFPVIIIAFVFTVASTNASVTGIGMTLFWGLLLELVFNTLITRTVFKYKD